MRHLVTVLKESFPKNDMTMLDLFCGDGSVMTKHFSPLCRFVMCVDADKQHFGAGFLENVAAPNKYMICADCIEMLQNLDAGSNPVTGRSFDLVSADSPQGIYGPGYCEHFDFIQKVPSLLNCPGFVLFNVNLQPFRPTSDATTKVSCGMNVEEYDEWMKRREGFYGTHPDKIGLNWMTGFYERLFGSLGWPLRFYSHHLRKSALAGHPDHIAYLLFRKG